MFGFPAAGGIRDGPIIRYVLISQQRTMLGGRDGTTTLRVRELQGVLNGAGFPTVISANIDRWLQGHATFVVPIAFALYRVGVTPARLAADPVSMRLMVLATRQAFSALRATRQRRDPHQPAHPLPTPDHGRHRLLAPCVRQSPGRTVVRRALPGRP